MERRVFLRNTLIGTSAVVLTPSAFLSSCKPTPVEGCAEWQFGQVNYLDVIPADWDGIFPTLPILEIRSAIGATLKASKLSIVMVGVNATPCYGFFGNNIWGPTLRLAVGETLDVDYENNIDTDSNVHFHGLIAPSANDGSPLNTVPSGANAHYAFPVTNRAGMYWYHAHVHKSVGKQMHLGLGGLLLVTGGDEIGLGLPSGDKDIHLVLQDKRLNDVGTLTYSPNISEKLSGYHGAGIFVNGVYGPRHGIKTRKYRVRFLNASNSRIYALTMDGGLSFTVIGGDGGLIPTPQTTGQLFLAPGERADTIIDFSGLAVGSLVTLRSATFGGAGAEGARGFDIMQFEITASETETYDLPGVLTTVTTPTPTATKTLNISNGGIDNDQLCEDSENIHGINGEIYDASVVNFTVNAGSAETWIFDNTNGKDPRAMHVQGAQGIITERVGGGGRGIKQWEKGWKDTFLCLPGETVKVVLQFSNYAGQYVVYTTNLENTDTGLMNIFEIV